MRTFEQRRAMLFLLTTLMRKRLIDDFLWFHFAEISGGDYSTYEALVEDEFIVYTGIKEDKPRHQFPNSKYELTLAGRRILTCPSEWVFDGVICEEHVK